MPPARPRPGAAVALPSSSLLAVVLVGRCPLLPDGPVAWTERARRPRRAARAPRPRQRPWRTRSLLAVGGDPGWPSRRDARMALVLRRPDLPGRTLLAAGGAAARWSFPTSCWGTAGCGPTRAAGFTDDVLGLRWAGRPGPGRRVGGRASSTPCRWPTWSSRSGWRRAPSRPSNAPRGCPAPARSRCCARSPCRCCGRPSPAAAVLVFVLTLGYLRDPAGAGHPGRLQHGHHPDLRRPVPAAATRPRSSRRSRSRCCSCSSRSWSWRRPTCCSAPGCAVTAAGATDPARPPAPRRTAAGGPRRPSAGLPRPGASAMPLVALARDRADPGGRAAADAGELDAGQLPSRCSRRAPARRSAAASLLALAAASLLVVLGGCVAALERTRDRPRRRRPW